MPSQEWLFVARGRSQAYDTLTAVVATGSKCQLRWAWPRPVQTRFAFPLCRYALKQLYIYIYIHIFFCWVGVSGCIVWMLIGRMKLLWGFGPCWLSKLPGADTCETGLRAARLPTQSAEALRCRQWSEPYVGLFMEWLNNERHLHQHISWCIV